MKIAFEELMGSDGKLNTVVKMRNKMSSKKQWYSLKPCIVHIAK
jgi:hypothetical protein